MHRLLARQLRRHLGLQPGDPVPESVAPLLPSIDLAYDQADKDRALLERALELTSVELLERNRELAASNEELKRFAYVASHDLQEPLRAITGYAHLLRRRLPDGLDPKSREFLDGMVGGAERMQRFIQDLLAYARLGAGAMQAVPCDLVAIADDALGNLRVAIEEARATVAIAPMPAVQGDPRQLGQLLQNLIGNAIKFRGTAVPTIRVGATATESRCRLFVADNGIGIDPAQAERVFEMFQRLHPVGTYEGTGIGLAICAKIVERHGGRIWVESHSGEGSTFWMDLPLAKEGPT